MYQMKMDYLAVILSFYCLIAFSKAGKFKYNQATKIHSKFYVHQMFYVLVRILFTLTVGTWGR